MKKKLVSTGEAQVFKAPELISTTDKTRLSIFLAGTIDMGNSDNWQNKLIEELKGFNVDIYSPRRDDWDSSWKQTFEDPQFFQQVTWELDALEKADLILLHFLPDSQSPISLLELGLFADSGKLMVVCPDEFWRSGNVQIVCNKYKIPLFKSLEEIEGWDGF
jgi:hypothetical protein